MDKKNNINLDQEDSQRIVYSKLSKDIQIQQNQFSSADNRVNGKYKNSKNKESFLKQNIKQRRTDILFRNLNDLFQRVKNLQNQGKQIQNQDIKNFVSDSCQIEKTIEEIEQYKTQNPEQFYSKNKFKLFPIYFYLTSKNFFIGILYFSSQSILECFCTYFLDMITENLKIYTGNYQQKRDLFLMLIAITIFYLAKNICYTRYLWYEAKWQVKSIAILQYLVFNKSLKIKNVSEGSNIEKKEANNSIQDEIPDINNIMTTDIEGLQQIYREVIGLIVNIITIILVLIMIYLKIGSHLFNGLYVLFFCLSLCIASVHFLIVIFLIQIISLNPTYFCEKQKLGRKNIHKLYDTSPYII